MNILLNLVDIAKSTIKCTIQHFPDGQQNIVLDMESYNNLTITPTSITIVSRLNNFKDLELIACSAACIKESDIELPIHLYTPYIVGARSDRKFNNGGNNYIKNVIAPILNTLNFKTVTCIDPHSDVLEACINNFRKQNNLKLINFMLDNTFPIKNLGSNRHFENFKNIILISPDAGANKKVFKVAEQIGFDGEIITCSKSRDNNGKISHIVVPIKENETKDIIIIDDICDGGATFENISAALNDAGHQGKKYLIVTHGIFSKGFENLSKYFDGIYCTNSYAQLQSNVESGHKGLIDLWIGSTEDQYYDEIPKNLVKQLNVF